MMFSRLVSRPVVAGSVGLLMAMVFGACAVSSNEPSGAAPGAVRSQGRVAARLAELGLELPEPTPPVANYVRAVTSGNLVFLAGHVPVADDGTLIAGRLGADISVEVGYQLARRTGIALLASLRQEIGDLDRVVRVVKVVGMVHSTPEFGEQPEVVNGCSDLLVEVFGEAGKHARSAVGMAALPRGAALEIEMIVEVGPAFEG